MPSIQDTAYPRLKSNPTDKAQLKRSCHEVQLDVDQWLKRRKIVKPKAYL